MTTGGGFPGGGSQPARSVLVAHPGSELYGSDRVLLDTVVELRERGWVVTVVLPEEGPLVELLRDAGAEVHLGSTPVLRKRFASPLGLLRLGVQAMRSLPSSIALVRSVRPDVVYVSTLTVPLWLVLGRLCRRPTVCHVHEAEAELPRGARAALALPLFFAGSIIVNSRFSLEVLIGSFPRLRRRSQVIANPVPAPRRVEPAREVLRAPVQVLYMGRLSPRKGPHLLVEAVSLLRERGTEVELTLVGAVFPGYEWYEEELRGGVKAEHLDAAVRFVGFQIDVWPWLAAADIVVVPSVAAEPFGNTAVEAVLAARPTVVSASGGLPEATEGFRSVSTVAVGESDAIARAIGETCSNWAERRAAAVEDAAVAARRHDRGLYGDAVERILARAASG